MKNKSQQVLDAIESAINVFEQFKMLNHLTPNEKQIVINELKHIAIAAEFN